MPEPARVRAPAVTALEEQGLALARLILAVDADDDMISGGCGGCSGCDGCGGSKCDCDECACDGCMGCDGCSCSFEAPEKLTNAAREFLDEARLLGAKPHEIAL